MLGQLWPAMRVVSRSKIPVGCRLRPVSGLGGAGVHLDLPHTKPGSDPTLLPLKPRGTSNPPQGAEKRDEPCFKGSSELPGFLR